MLKVIASLMGIGVSNLPRPSAKDPRFDLADVSVRSRVPWPFRVGIREGQSTSFHSLYRRHSQRLYKQ